MIIPTWWIWVIAAAGLGCATPRAPGEGLAARPVLAIVHGRILGHPGATTLVIEDGLVARVGGPVPERARQIDARGGLVLPGFRDEHAHLMSGASALTSASLGDARNTEDLLAILARHAGAHPDNAWVIGRGWQYDVFAQGEAPAAARIDAILPDRPVFLESYDGHSAWVNTKALALAGIGASDPPGGRIVRGPDDLPTGELLEGAIALVEDRIPPPDRDAKRALLELALAHLVRRGVTSATDITRDPEVVEIYASLEAEGRLPIRVTVSLPIDGDVEAFAALARRHRTERVRVGPLKGFVDGVIESRTALLVEPYAGSTDRGAPMLPKEELERQVRRAEAAGFPVILHAIGDAAVRMALDVFEGGPRSAGHRIEHIELIHPDDLPRFAALGVTASMQPYHANPFGDSPDEGRWSKNLGPERLPWTFPWRALRNAGASLVFGSDWPVMSADPLEGLAVAITRQDEEGRPAAGWNAHQRLGVEEAILAYTGRTRIEPRQPADLVVLDSAVDLEVPRTLWRDDAVRCVVVGGAIAWCDSPPGSSSPSSTPER